MKRAKDDNSEEQFCCALAAFNKDTKDLFDAYFINSNRFVQLASQYIGSMPRLIAPYDNDLVTHALFLFHYTLRTQIRHYRPYVGVSLRCIPFFRSLYWEQYRLLRLGIRFILPIDIVWMILERTHLTKPITEQIISNATRAMIRQASYFNRFYLSQLKEVEGDDNPLYLWGEELAELLLFTSR